MNIFTISLSSEGGLQILAAWWLVFVFIAALGIALIARHQQLFGKELYLEVDEAEIGIGTGKLKLKVNIDDLQVGFKLWTELTTRKIGLPLDEEHDVIIEIYNSWYDFFAIAREMIKIIPVSKIRANKSTKELVRISIHILNNELRPHLTRWQARYHHWWDQAIIDPAYKGVSPQEIQRNYPEYKELIAEMKMVNSKVVLYAKDLRKMLEI